MELGSGANPTTLVRSCPQSAAQAALYSVILGTTRFQGLGHLVGDIACEHAPGRCDGGVLATRGRRGSCLSMDFKELAHPENQGSHGPGKSSRKHRDKDWTQRRLVETGRGPIKTKSVRLPCLVAHLDGVQWQLQEIWLPEEVANELGLTVTNMDVPHLCKTFSTAARGSLACDCPCARRPLCRAWTEPGSYAAVQNLLIGSLANERPQECSDL